MMEALRERDEVVCTGDMEGEREDDEEDSLHVPLL